MTLRRSANKLLQLRRFLLICSAKCKSFTADKIHLLLFWERSSCAILRYSHSGQPLQGHWSDGKQGVCRGNRSGRSSVYSPQKYVFADCGEKFFSGDCDLGFLVGNCRRSGFSGCSISSGKYHALAPQYLSATTG